MLPFKSLIKLDTDSAMPLYLQIANAIIREISQGRIAPGLRMPSSRKMAAMLDLNRRTVVAGYDELTAQGWLISKSTSGTFVSDELPTLKARSLRSDPVASGRAIPKLKAIPRPLAKFDDGHPDVRLAPLVELSRAYTRLLRSNSFHYNLDYTHQFAGDPMLRRQLAIYLRDTRGIYVDIDQILITRGSIMAFYLIMESYLKPGQNVVVGTPGYTTFNQIVTQKQGNLIEIPVDQQGIIVDEVEALCKRRAIHFLYVIPHHHHPTTVTLSPERRLRLLALAQRYNFRIIEDDYDFDFHYESSPILPLASLQHDGKVMYVGSFSKPLAPALRLGFLVGDAETVNKLAGLRRLIDRTGDPLLERAVSHLLKHGEIKRHFQKSLKAYRSRRDHLCSLFDKSLHEHIAFQIPEGGMAAWVGFRGEYDLHGLWRLFEKNGLSISHPEAYIKNAGRHTRIGFASCAEEEIERGISILKQCIYDYLA